MKPMNANSGVPFSSQGLIPSTIPPVVDPTNSMEPSPFHHQLGPRIPPLFVPDELFLAWIRCSCNERFRLQHPSPTSIHDLFPTLPIYRERLLPNFPLGRIPDVFLPEFSIADIAHEMLVALMLLSCWELDIYGENGAAVVVFWNKGAKGWEFKEAGHERRRWHEELSDAVDTVRSVVAQQDSQPSNPFSVVREIVSLINISVARWYLRTLDRFMVLAFPDHSEVKRREFVQVMLVDERALFDGRTVASSRLPLSTSEASAFTSVCGQTPEHRAQARDEDIFEFRGRTVTFPLSLSPFPCLMLIPLLPPAVADTGTFHPFDATPRDPGEVEGTSELSAFIVEGAGVGYVPPRTGSGAPLSSYSPEDRFLFHGVPPPTPTPVSPLDPHTLNLNANMCSPSPSLVGSPSPRPLAGNHRPRVSSDSGSGSDSSSADSHPPPSKQLSGFCASPTQSKDPCPQPEEHILAPIGHLLLNLGRNACLLLALAPEHQTSSGPILPPNLWDESPAVLAFISPSRKVDEWARWCESWSRCALFVGVPRKTMTAYRGIQFAYWEHVGKGYFVPLVPDPRLSDLAGLSARTTFCELLYNFLPPLRTAGTLSHYSSAREGPSTTERANTASAESSAAAPRLDPVLVLKLPAGVRRADYVRDDEDIDMSLFRDTPNSDNTDNDAAPGPSSRPAAASGSGAPGFIQLQEPVFMGFPADATTMLEFFEEHPEANEADFFVYMSALLGIMHKEYKRRQDVGSKPNGKKSEKGKGKGWE
ncbi:hypothetical protein C8F04DRAFT_1258954 [Mycena alexandri]|uniref:Uncharacterized protein n=1 Tax=Mycena alexandri TaxID=1745969 RepID=A0AAD6X3L0_9AGAR|nr:hypothetical protein C8F04DRAFT_1258954 [Mycena alexandri]